MPRYALNWMMWAGLLPKVVLSLEGDRVVELGWQVRAVWDVSRLLGLGW